VFRIKSESACDKWIEIINSATIFSKFWSLLMQKSSRVSEYFWQLNQEKLEIKCEESSNQSSANEEVKKTEDFEKKESANRNSMQSEKSKIGKKERRKNPYTQRKLN
jgi:hypothetical protein